MKQFTKKLSTIMVVVLILAMSASAMEIINKQDTKLNLGGRITSYGAMELVQDELKDNPRILLFVRDTRLQLDGMRNNVKFELEVALGGEADNMLGRPSSGDNASQPITSLLLDAWAEIKITDYLSLRAGQFKAPYSRENIADGNELQFTHRSLNHKALNIGRDTGIMFHGQMDNKYAALGIFTGGGINQRVRYLPVKMGAPLTVLRLGYSELEDHIMDAREITPGKEGKAFFVNALYVENTLVGHGSVMSMRQHSSSYLFADWNPYMTGAYGETLMQFGADAAYQKEIMDGKLLVLGAEFNYGSFESDAGSMSLSAFTARAGLSLNNWLEVAGRFSTFMPDEAIGFLEDEGFSSFTPAVNCYFNETVRLQMDLPIVFNAPFAIESGNGEYNVINQPQTYLPIERRTAVTGRMTLMINF